ncbi:retrovirus-related pol polyprotein from transposon TNT 1-94 [Tanacetum coccineum]
MSLTAYADADHAGCQDSRRSTSRSAQFLGDRLVSWSSKKQRSTAISINRGGIHCNVWMLCSNPLDEISAKRLWKMENGVVELYFVETNINWQISS